MFFAIFIYAMMIIGTLFSIHDMGMSLENVIACIVDVLIGILFLAALIGEQMIQLLLFYGFMILLALAMALFAGLIALIIAIVVRVWPNYITPWLDKHFGESDL